MLKISPAIEKSRIFARAWIDPWVVLMAVEAVPLASQDLDEKAQVRNWTLVGEILEQPGLPSELSVPRGGRSPEDAHLPVSTAREEREGSTNLTYLKSAKYNNVRTFDSSP